MTETVESKPVYKTGEPLGAIIANNEAAQQQATTFTAQAAPETQPSVAPVGNVNPEPVATPEVTTPETAVVPEENVISFSTPVYGEEVKEVAQPAQTNTTVTPTPVFNWKDEIKKLSPDEILKELGVSDFSIELDKHIKNGGDPSAYLDAKAIKWESVSDEEVVKNDYKKQFPNLTSSEINRLFNRKYGITDVMDDEEKEDRLLELKTDAHTKRQTRISEQQNFKIPSAIPIVSNQPNNEEQQRQAAEEQRRQFDAAIQWYNEQEATKKLMESKRVAISLGDMGTFNFAIDKPENLMKPILDGEVWQRVTSVNPGEPDVNKLIPDVNKLQRLSLVAMNPNYEVDLVNYGKSLKLRELQNEGHNLKAPMRVIPQVDKNTGEKDMWRNAKTGTVGG